jgi:hypothetical protein
VQREDTYQWHEDKKEKRGAEGGIVNGRVRKGWELQYFSY